MRLASPSLNSPSLTLPQNQRSGGIGVKKGLMAVALAVSTGLYGCEGGASKKVGDTWSSFRNSLPVGNGDGNGAKFVNGILSDLSNTGNRVEQGLIDKGIFPSGKPNPIILNPDKWLEETAKRNNCAGTEAVLATQKPFPEVIAASETSQRKVSNQGVINSPIFKDLDFRTPEKKVEEALVRNPLAQQTTAQNPQQAIKVLWGNYNSIDLVLAKMGHPDTINRIARDVVDEGLVQQAELELTKRENTHPKLVEQGREALRVAQTTTPAMQTMLPGWGQNVLDLKDRAEKISSSSPNSTLIRNALGQFDIVNQEAENGNRIAQTFIREITTALGSADISNQDALFIGRNIPSKNVKTMTLEEQLTELGNMNQNVFGAGVTPETEELLNQSGMTPLPGSDANGFVGSGN